MVSHNGIRSMPPLLPSALPAAPPTACLATTAARWRNVGVFLAALAVVHFASEAALPLPNVGDVSEKLAYFARHKDDFDAVFVGSSRISGQIAPDLFDQRVTARTGHRMRSFNLGAPSMYLPESLYVIDCILAQRPARLRWMFIELDEPRLRVEEHAGLVRREVYWHGLRETALMNACIFTAHGFHPGERVRMLAHQWALFGRRWTHVGRAQEWLANGLPEDGASDKTAALGAAGDGYTPYRATLGEEKTGGKDMRRELKTFTAAAAALKGKREKAAPQNPPMLLRWLLTEKIHTLHAQNVEPVFVIGPVTTGEAEFLRLSGEGVACPLFAFNDPAAYPELYEVNMRADTMHLNAPGSLRFTGLLAERFADHLASASVPPR